MAAIRRATVKWNGDLNTGDGAVSAITSRAFTSLPVTWASRTEHADGRTSPEELLAAAHATCFSMALSGDLTKAGTPPDRVEVTSEVAFDRVDGKWTVVSSKLTVRGKVRGLDNDGFRKIAEQTKDGCPISRAIAGNVAISLDAALE
jgi:osmotically inducible protein OsmC